jgi:uncharacterized membrane protein YeaQ/YmgE (transglycosylase-associated protein family)
MEPEKFKLKDLGYGLVIPILVGLLILAFATVIRSGLLSAFPMETGNPIPHILTFGFAQMIMFGVPLMLGLLWNKWAGGAAGFITGTLYYIANAGYAVATFAQYGMSVNFWADASLLCYIVVGILIGYIAGSLSNGSSSFKRMLGAGLTAAIATGAIQTFANLFLAVQENLDMAWGVPPTIENALYAVFLAMLPMVILGILVPIVAKVMTWYGLKVQKSY